jgi:hypothetical protein
MSKTRILIRILVWFFVVLCITATIFLNFFLNINQLKKLVEKNLKDQLTCVVKLGTLDWDLDAFKLGVTTSNISLFDQENNLVLQAGPTRFTWDIRNFLKGRYAHFYSINSTNLYVNVIRSNKGKWNLIEIFPPGPVPEVDNLRLNNSILYLIDELNPKSRESLYKDLNLVWEIAPETNKRRIDLTTRIGSLDVPSFLNVKGKYLESHKFNWDKDNFNFYITAKNVDLSNFYGYFANLIKEPELKSLKGEVSGILFFKKIQGERFINIRSRTSTRDFLVNLKNADGSQAIEIPKTDFILRAVVSEDKIDLHTFRSKVDELTYDIKGSVVNWSKKFPDANLEFKTNRFNFKKIKPYLPLSLLPVSTRMRIEPINDDGFVTLDLKLKGNQYTPKYFGTILLDDFNLTQNSGFISIIKGLNGKLVLDNQIMKIEYLNIPIETTPLVIKGFIDSEKIITSFNLAGNGLNVTVLKDLITQSGLQPPIVDSIIPDGKLNLNLDIFIDKNKAPDIKGNIGFDNLGALLLTNDPLEIKNVFGNLILDGTKIIFEKVEGLINNEPFSIKGNLSLKEDEKVDLIVEAKHLKILNSIVSLLTEKTPFKTVGKTVKGEASDLNLKIAGTLTKPILDGMVFINHVGVSLPGLDDTISDITGNLKFQGTDLLIESVTGMIQNATFEISGLINDLLSVPKPRIKLITGNIEISNLWKFVKEQLKTSSLSVQAEALKKLSGFASLDILVNPTTITGNIDFMDGIVRYETIPFDLTMLEGMVLIDEKNINLIGFMGDVGEKNKFACDLVVYNYLDSDFTLQGMIQADVDPDELVMSINPELMNAIISEGIIPTQINFDGALPLINLNVVSVLDEMLKLELPGYLKKPDGKSYTIAGDVDFDSSNLNLIIHNLNLKSDKLSVTTKGSIKNLNSKEPEIMLFFNSDEPCGLNMILEPLVPLMGFKMWGMIDFNGSVSGTASKYEVSSYAMLYQIEIPDIMGKKLTATDGAVNTFFDGKSGVLNADVNNVMIAALNAKFLSISANYVDPVVNINKFILDSEQGNIIGLGYYDPRDGSFDFNANGKAIDLGALASLSLDDTTKLAGNTDFSIMAIGKGVTSEEILKNTKGDVSFTVTEGKVGQVALLQKVLQFSNLFSSGIFGFNLSNVFSLFFKYQDGSFNKMHGHFELDEGIINTEKFAYAAKDLLLNAFGSIDLNKSLLDMKFYGYLPISNIKTQNAKLSKTSVANKVTNTVSGAITIIPDAFGKARFFIPFLSANNSRYFKFDLAGNTKDQKKIVSKARKSFKWLNKTNQKKENAFLPKI